MRREGKVSPLSCSQTPDAFARPPDVPWVGSEESVGLRQLLSFRAGPNSVAASVVKLRTADVPQNFSLASCTEDLASTLSC